ncbi:hypothetical protein ANRL2_04435 [Anaerolineae bacterium]|nr:hypothetical protein ANRL2_04435 [Anaerolineae bacterium]
MFEMHPYEDCYELFHEGGLLFRYVFQPDVPASESPKPYFHPLNTLGGHTITGFRPADHPWHTGLAMTMAYLSWLNFWGGPTYVHGQGYIQLPNNGQIQHTAWSLVECQNEQARLVEQLAWIAPSGEVRLDETRHISAVIADDTIWYLDFEFHLTNISRQTLEFGSPTTQGRPNAGYGGLFWRGPLAWQNPQICLAEQPDSQAVMGTSAAWLAYSGGASDQRATLVFMDHPTNPRYPNQWFVRESEYVGVCFAFMFDQAYFLLPDETLTLRYRVAIADGDLSATTVNSLTQSFLTED